MSEHHHHCSTAATATACSGTLLPLHVAGTLEQSPSIPNCLAHGHMFALEGARAGSQVSILHKHLVQFLRVPVTTSAGIHRAACTWAEEIIHSPEVGGSRGGSAAH